MDSVTNVVADMDASTPGARSLLRFRGMAQVQRQRAVALTDEEYERAAADLSGALEADPTDWEAAVGLVQLNRGQYFLGVRSRRDDILARGKAGWEKAMADATARFPGHPAVALQALEIRVDDALRATPALPERMKVMAEMKGAEAPLVGLMTTADPSTLNGDLIARTILPGRVLALLQPNEYQETALKVINHALTGRPKDSALLYLRGTTLVDMGRYEEGDADFQTIVELPDLPVSLDGLLLKSRQREALFQQANLAIDRWEKMAPGAEREAAMALAKQRRASMGSALGEGNRLTLLIDGKIATAEGRDSDAVRFFQQLNADTGNQSPEILRLLAGALERQGTLGAAREVYNRLIEVSPTDVIALTEAANLDLRLQDIDSAITRIEQALLIAPGSEMLETQLDTLRAAAGQTTQAADPVVARMMAAQAAARLSPPDWATARKSLEEARGLRPDDPRPIPMLAETLAARGDVEGAKALVDEGLKASPDNPTLHGMRARFESKDPVEAQLSYIDRMGEEEAVKWIQRQAVYSAAGQREKALECLLSAEKANPDHPMVVDALFVRALFEKDMTRARALAAKAAEQNLDQAGGLLFQARIAMQENQMEGALSDLNGAVERAPFSAQAHRLRGQVLLRLGRVEDAVEALKKAHQFKPDDAEIALAYASTLMRLQRNVDALSAVRSARKFNAVDPRLNEMWLALEAVAGNPGTAIETRRTMHAADPANLENTRALISLLIEAGTFEEAGFLIRETTAKSPDDMSLAILEARWLARKGDAPGGAARLRAYVATLPADRMAAEPFVALGDFLIENNRVEEGLAAYREGATHQTKEIMLANRRMGDFLFSAGRYEEALAAYTPVLDAGVDKDNLVLKRVVETLVRLRRWNEAEARLEKLGAGRDLQATLLLADVCAGRAVEQADTPEGRAALLRARTLLDKAVEIAPNQPEPFIRRAQFDMNDPERQRFVLSDLEQALRLAPNSVPARTMRAVVLANADRRTEAIAELREGIRVAPQSSELRQMLIIELYDGGFKREAHEAATEAVAANPDSWEWLMIAGDVYARDSEWKEARVLYDGALQRRPSKAIALRAANACLYQNPADAEAALAALDVASAASPDDSELTVVRARALDKQGKREAALAMAAQSLAYASKPETLRHWYLHVEELFSDKKSLIDYLDRQRPPVALEPEYAVHAATHQALDFSRHDDILANLTSVESAVDDPPTRIALYRVIGQIAYGKQRHQEAAEAFRKGLALSPDDLEFNNNLAYTLSKHLGDDQGALAPAEHAVRLAGSDSSALDTLGWVNYRLKRLSQAQGYLQKAVQTAQSLPEKAASNMHLARVLLAQGDLAAARRHADVANGLIEKNPGLKGEFGADFVELMRALEEAESTR